MGQNVVPNKAVGNVIPTGVSAVDPVSGIASTVHHCKYTVITTSGTTTVSPSASVLVGASVVVLATATGAIQLLDGTTALTGTFTATAVNQTLYPGGTAGPVGVRCLTSIVVVTTGTNANTWNILWD